MNKTVYLSKEILDWNGSVVSSLIIDPKDLKRPYQIIAHSEQLLNNYTSDFHLSDAISNLKKAIDHRLKVTEKHYDFKRLKLPNMPKGYLELLEMYGIVKPYVVKILLEIRNGIEHQDHKPPNLNRCKELLDITWYFLKSTDRLVSYVVTDIELDPPVKLPDKYVYSIKVDHSEKDIEISGWFPLNFIYKTGSPDTLKVICDVIHDGLYWKGKFDEYHKDKTENDFWVSGKFELGVNEKLSIFKKILDTI